MTIEQQSPKTKVAYPKRNWHVSITMVLCMILLLSSIWMQSSEAPESETIPAKAILTASQADTRVWVEAIAPQLTAPESIAQHESAEKMETLTESVTSAEKLLSDIQEKINMQKIKVQLASAQRRLSIPSVAYQLEHDQKNAHNNKLSQLFADSNQFANDVANQSTVTMEAQQQQQTDLKIFQGKIIPGVLDTAVNSDLPGMVRATISEDVYAETGRTILLPRGTRLIGQYNSAVTTGQVRVYIIWTRAITPQQIDIRLAAPGIDALGRGGLAGQVDNHFWDTFGTAMLLSVMAAGVADIETPNSDTFYGNPYQAEVVEAFTENSDNVLSKRLDIKPTISLDQGTPVRVMVAHDLDFSELAENRINP